MRLFLIFKHRAFSHMQNVCLSSEMFKNPDFKVILEFRTVIEDCVGEISFAPQRSKKCSGKCWPAKSCSAKLYWKVNCTQIQIGHIQIIYSINSITFLFCLTDVEFKASRREIAHLWKRILLSQFEDNRNVLEIST